MGRGRADRDSEGEESGTRGGGGWGLWIGMAFDPVDFSFHRRDEVRWVLRSPLEGSWVILGPLKGWTWTQVPLLLWGSPTLTQPFFFFFCRRVRLTPSDQVIPLWHWREWTGLESTVLRPPNRS